MKLITTSLSGLILAAASVFSCQASTIQLGITGDAQIGYSSIEFANAPLNTTFAPPPTSGNFQVAQVSTGMLTQAGVATGQYGTIQSFSESPSAVVSLNASSPFISLEAGTLNFYVTSIPAGGTVGSFSLTDTPNGTVGSLDVNGYFINTLTNATQNYSGVFSATFVGYTVAQLESSLPLTTPYSGTFSANVATPEPASLLLMGSGLIALGFISRRKLRTA